MGVGRPDRAGHGVAASFAVALVVALLAFLGALQAPALAQGAEEPAFDEFGPFLVDPERPDAIILNGPILETTLLDFRRAARAFPEARTLVLNSPGGLIATALAIADEVNEDGFATVIPSWAGCYSACAFIYLAGADRAVLGELGVHQFNADEPDLDVAQRMMADVLEILGRFETAPELISLMLRTPPEDMYVFDADEIVRFELNRGFADGAEAFEFAAVGALAPTRGDPAQAAAVLYVDPDAGWRELEGEVDWWVEEEDGRVVVAAEVRFDDGDLRIGIVLGEVFAPDNAGALVLAVHVDGGEYVLKDGRDVAAVTTRPRGSEETRATSFGLGPTIDDPDAAVLVSLRRWVITDIGAMRDADAIELWFTDRNGDDVVLQLQATSVLESVLAGWMEAATELPVGDLPEEEEAQPAEFFVGDATEGEEGTVTWFVGAYQLGARITAPGLAYWIDLSFSSDKVYVSIEPPSAFEDEPVAALSLFPDLEWTRLEMGYFSADLSPQQISRLTLLLARADEMELELVMADGTPVRIVVGTGDRYDLMLDAVLEAGANQPAEDRNAAAPPGNAPATIRRPDFALDPTFGEVSLARAFRPDP